MNSSGTARMPSGIPFIVANEFAERFCYYGINAILAVYLVQSLHFGDAQATTWVSLFKSGSYFFPLLGAVVSDVFWGKFRTVITFSARLLRRLRRPGAGARPGDDRCRAVSRRLRHRGHQAVRLDQCRRPVHQQATST